MIEIKDEIRLHSAIFFLYGFFGMAWVPRFPELKAFLGLTNGEFGFHAFQSSRLFLA
ncbi:MAG: hypothetical protein RLZZ73_538 [Actinomycetota bacterium]